MISFLLRRERGRSRIPILKRLSDNYWQQ